MLANVGHTFQKIINNKPVAISANSTSTTVVTNGGNMYQTGLLGEKVQFSFQEVISSDNFVGQIVDVESVESGQYILNDNGAVFYYENRENGPSIAEVYSPQACGEGDKAVKIVAGRDHCLIQTKSGKVWGVGNNSEYQLVPQGKRRYKTATEVLITDTNLHDNECCGTFSGVFNELVCPVIPQCETNKCHDITCIKDTKCDVHLGYYNIDKMLVSPPSQSGILSVPIYGDVSYTGFLCVDAEGCVSGSVTWSVTRLYIKCGCFVAKFTSKDKVGCHVREFNASNTTELVIFEASPCNNSNTNFCASPNSTAPLTGSSQIQGKCGSCVVINVDIPKGIPIPGADFECESKALLLEFGECRSSVVAMCDTVLCGISDDANIDLALDFEIKLDCCTPYKPPKPEVELPQPCWRNIYAGSDITVLVDSCDRMYVLGSLYKIRSNKDLLKSSCLEDLLSKANASVSFQADQLNLAGNKVPRNNANCKCSKCTDKEFKTDLSKFGIHLNFPSGDECDPRSMNLTQFLNKIKQCNESRSSGTSTCEPCDGYIYLNVSGDCGCPCGAPSSCTIGSITLLNKKSICKLVSQDCPDVETVRVNYNTIVEYDLNRYCIDTTDVALDKIVKLDFCEDGPNVNVYLDVDQPGGLKFMSNGKKCNVEFTVSASSDIHQFILNYGPILDPTELTNLKYALSLDCYFPCAKYKNPFNTKITNTYLKGGDRVKFVTANPKNIRQAITADVPTIFRLNRRVLDLAVGNNNLTVLTGGFGCPNELYALGSNCHGELGLASNETYVCWKQLNRDTFDSQITNLFAGKNVTFYVTQSHEVYAAGQWKCFVNSTYPVPIKSICPTWKINQIAIAKNHIIFLGPEGCIFGLGDNSVGELGLCHLDCVTKPTPLSFFYKLNGAVSKQLRDMLAHPMESRRKPYYGGNGCQPCQPCAPCPPCPPYGGNFGQYGQMCNYCGQDPCVCRSNKYGKNKGPSKKYSPNARIVPNRFRQY